MQRAEFRPPAAGEHVNHIHHMVHDTCQTACFSDFFQTCIVPAASQGIEEKEERHGRNQADEEQDDAGNVIARPNKLSDESQEQVVDTRCNQGSSQRLPEIETLREAVFIGNKVRHHTAHQYPHKIGNDQRSNLESRQQHYQQPNADGLFQQYHGSSQEWTVCAQKYGIAEPRQELNRAISYAMKWGEISPTEFYSLEELAEILSVLGPDILRRIAQLVRQKLEHGHRLGKDEQIICTERRQDTILTKRERDVLILTGRRLTNREIADRLCMSIGSVKIFLNRACRKLGARKRDEAVLRALKQREISVGEISSLNEIVQYFAPSEAESVEKMAQLLDQKLRQEPIPSGS